MFRLRLFKNLTDLSDNTIDWTRTGELLFSHKHRYSKRELLIRGSIIFTTATFAFLGYSLNNQDKTHCSNIAMSLMSGFLGFVIAHGVAIIPIVTKRRNIRIECETLKDKIIEQSIALSLPQNDIDALLNKIFEFTLEDDNRANASQTWGHRLTLLKNFDKCLRENNIFFLNQLDLDLMLEYLELYTLRKKNPGMGSS